MVKGENRALAIGRFLGDEKIKKRAASIAARHGGLKRRHVFIGG
jgi:hypothetical protein